MISCAVIRELVAEELRQTAQVGPFVTTCTTTEGQLVDVFFAQIWTIPPVTCVQMETKLFPSFDLALFTFSRISWSNEQNFAFTNFVVVFVVFNVKSSEKKRNNRLKIIVLKQEIISMFEF